jgi:hypothetical protein
MQKDMQVKVLRSNSFYKKLSRKITILAYMPTRLERENIKAVYSQKTLFENKKNIYIPTNENNFFGEEAVNLGFKKFFESLKNRYIFETTKQNYVAVHLRRNNIVPSHQSYVSDDWYLKKLNLFNKSKYEFAFFTDSINISDLSNFSQYRFLVYGREVHPLEAIIRLSNYNNLILSKSTFSFWAAALSEAKIVISPFENEPSHLHMPFNLRY